MGLLDFLGIGSRQQSQGQGLLGMLSAEEQARKRRQQAAYEANTQGNLDPKVQERFKAEQRLGGLSEALLGLPDMLNTAINAGITDVDYFTGGGLSGGTYNPYQLPMASEAANRFAAESREMISGTKPVDPKTMPKDVQKQAGRERRLFGMIPTGAEDVAGLTVPAMKAMFLGLKKSGTPEEAADALTALERLAKGEDPKTVWAETKWAVDPIGKVPYTEISDQPMAFRPGVEAQLAKGRVQGKLRDIIDHPELFKAYPGLGGIMVDLGTGKYGGSWNGNTQWIKGSAPGILRGTGPTDKPHLNLEQLLTHEIQHVIQQYEKGWPGGSNLSAGSVITPEIADDIQLIKDAETKRKQLYKIYMTKHGPEATQAYKDWQELGRAMNLAEDEIRVQKAYQYYRRQPGEVQARNTGEGRFDLTEEERRAQHPEETMDVPVSEQVKTYGTGFSKPKAPLLDFAQEMDQAESLLPGGVLREVEQSVEPPAKPGKRRAITEVSLRDMQPEEALRIAQSEQHLIPQPKGGYSGAPVNVRSPEDIAVMRQSFDDQVEAGLTGANWYARSQDWIKRVAGSDPKAQSELAHNLGIMSSQADPKSNLGFSIRARNAAIMDKPVSVVHTGRQARDYQRAYEEGVNPPTGKKTGIFARSMDPTMTNPVTGTNDIWHARSFGYTNPKTGKHWEAALSPQQHAFMDAETVLAVGRANARKMGGRDDWTAGEIQAAPWVAAKGRDLMRRWNNKKAVKAGKMEPMSEEDGMALARMTYPDYEEAFTGYGQHEMVPGADKHLPGVTAGDEALRSRFSDDPRSWWKGKGDRDILYSKQGAYTAPTEDMTGMFEGKTNKGQSARPLIAYEGKSGKREMDEASKALMKGTEAFRAYVDAQKSGSSIGLIPGQQAGHSNAYLLNNLPPDMQEAEGLLGLMAKGQEAVPGADVVHFGGPKGLLSDWREAGIPTKEKKAIKGVMGELGIEATPVRREGAMAPPYDPERGEGGFDWSTEGSDTATKQMLSEVSPTQRKAFEDPEVRQRVLARMDRDEAFADEGGGVRKDIQYARKLFSKEGFVGLERALGKGLLPAAAVGIFLPYMIGGQREKEKT